MFNWDTDLTSKKLIVEDDLLTIRVKDGSGFKTSIGDQVRQQSPQIFTLTIGLQIRGQILLLDQVDSGKPR